MQLTKKLSGVVFVDKPAGMTSHDVVSRCRRILKTKEIGHCGTLDPLATGLMVILVGEATKLSSYLTEQNKRYRVTVAFGKSSDTWDRDPVYTDLNEVKWPSADQIQNQANELTGSLNLKVPNYSAIKIDGKKLVDEARKGRVIEAPLREMSFFSVHLIEVSPQMAVFDIHCSKGSYIRSWTHELGQKLECGAIVWELRRTSSGEVQIDQAVKLEDLNENHILPALEALKDWSKVSILDQETKDLRNGKIPQGLLGNLVRSGPPPWAIHRDHELVALLGKNPKGIQILRVFN